MANIGSIEQFEPENPAGWETYKDRLEFYLTANSVTDKEMKKAVFVTVCGAATYDILKSLLAPEKVKDTEYEEILKVLTNHFQPRTSKIVSRFKFYRRDQQDGESFATYLKELRRLAEDCGFNAHLETMLRDRLVCGIKNDGLQKKLLSEVGLTFQKAQELCTAQEAAEQSLELIKQNNGNVHLVKKTHSKFEKKGKFAQQKGCYRCDGDHDAEKCNFKDKKCRYCQKIGHIAKACYKRKKQEKSGNRVHKQETETSENDSENDDYESLNNVRSNKPTGKFTVEVTVEGKKIPMEVDSGAAQSVICQSLFEKLFYGREPKVTKSNIILKDYQEGIIPIAGKCDVQVSLGKKQAVVPLLIVKTHSSSLIGRTWFGPLGLSIAGIKSMTSTVDYVQEFPKVFDRHIGKYRGPPVSFEFDKNTQPILMKARKVPFALKERIEKELERLVEEGVLEPVDHPRWCTPIVVVAKNDTEVRICGDYRSTINRVLIPDKYPVPSVQHILKALAGGKVFAKLDMAKAYLQLSVDKDTAEAQTIITHKGAFRCNRLQFGVSVAPQRFQRFIDLRLAGIEGVLPYYDDILVVGRSEEDLEKKLRVVLQRFQDDGLRLKKEKCVFRTKSLEFLGFHISPEGIQPTQGKIEAIMKTSAPTDVKQLQSFLGLVTFYHIFFKDKASICEPLNKLLSKSQKWKWGTAQEKAFEEIKKVLTEAPLLVHYEEKRPLILTCDASPYGVGCILSQPDEKGRDCPVEYHSRTLSSAERNYAQIDKEALAIIEGVKKFHYYLYGRFFTIRTDHKPLLGLLNSKKPTPEILSPRMLRWTILLTAYDYDLEYLPGGKITNADALSRLPIKSLNQELPEENIMMLESVPERLLEATEIATETKRSRVLSTVFQWVRHGWPRDSKTFPNEFRTFFMKKDEISCYQDCLMWGSRLVIPPNGRNRVLEILHSAHPGIVRMKSLRHRPICTA